jgi:hypothetical protein
MGLASQRVGTVSGSAGQRGGDGCGLALVPRGNATAEGLRICPGCGGSSLEGGYCFYCRDAAVDLDFNPRAPKAAESPAEKRFYQVLSCAFVMWFTWETRGFWLGCIHLWFGGR